MSAMKALQTSEKGLGVRWAAKPTISDEDEIIVQVKAVALNPTDWKRALGASKSGGGAVTTVTPNLIVGCDFSGVVVESGGGYDTRKLKVGDKVAGFIMGAKWEGHGSFAEYVKTEGTLVWKIPEGTSFEDAAAMGGISQHTAYQMLFRRATPALPRPDKPLTKENTFPIVIWAGATSCGIYSIQYAKAAGLTVITTASPANHELLKSYGADFTFDYRDPETPAKIKAQFPNIKYGTDNICQQGSSLACSKTFGPEGGHLVVTLPSQDEGTQAWPAKVDVESVLVYTVLGKEFTFPGHAHGKFTKERKGHTIYPVRIDDRFDVADWNELLPKLIQEGKFKAMPTIVGQGLEQVPEGLQRLKDGNVRASKLVYTL